MGYWQKNTKPLLNTDVFTRLLNEKLTVIDGGAANGIFEPFDIVVNNCQIVLFEPNPAANCYRSALQTIHVPYGLWSHKKTLNLHIANKEGTSSVYPPNNDLLAQFSDDIGEPVRRTKRVEEVQGVSIDSAVERNLFPSPDFIKLDIHSSEYEAILGAENSLQGCSAILVETWHHPVHEGQHLHARVESFLNDQGFLLYDLRPAGKWKLKSEQENNVDDRGILVGSESLFFRSTAPTGKELAYIALLDLFQYEVAAINNCKKYLPNNEEEVVRSTIEKYNKKHAAYIRKIVRKICSKIHV